MIHAPTIDGLEVPRKKILLVGHTEERAIMAMGSTVLSDHKVGILRRAMILADGLVVGTTDRRSVLQTAPMERANTSAERERRFASLLHDGNMSVGSVLGWIQPEATDATGLVGSMAAINGPNISRRSIYQRSGESNGSLGSSDGTIVSTEEIIDLSAPKPEIAEQLWGVLGSGRLVVASLEHDGRLEAQQFVRQPQLIAA
jgi:hypothetical protein